MTATPELSQQISDVQLEISRMREMLAGSLESSKQITLDERVRTERELLRTVIDEIPDFVVLKDHEGNFLLCNKPVADFYGTSPEAMVGKHDGHFSASPEQAEFFRQNVLSIMEKGKTEIVFEDSTDDRTKEVRHFKSIKKPFVSNDGKNKILIIAHDITDLIRAQEATKQSARRLQYVLEATGEGIWDWDISTGIVTHNARWSEILGLTDSELSNTLDEFARFLHPDDSAETMQAVENSLKTGADYRHEHRMICKDGKEVWVLDRGRVVERDAMGRPSRMVGSMSDITAAKMADREISNLAFYDPLTSLPNRRLLFERLERAILLCGRQQNMGALFFVDINDFKAINDSKGHKAGDDLLKGIAQRLHKSIREVDTVSRVGGDEFVVLVSDIGQTTEEATSGAEAVGRKIVAICDDIFFIDNFEHKASISVGVSFLCGDTANVEEPLRQADMAMYVAKSMGRNVVRFFDTQIEQNITTRIKVEAELRNALSADEMRLMFQPITHHAGALVGVEALVRWQHPDRGTLMPGEFIALAEQTGLIHALGATVMEKACLQLVEWQTDSRFNNLKIAVNVSAREFHQPDFVDQVVNILQRTNAPASRLKIELTESIMLTDVEGVIKKMNKLKRYGITFALDDFGTGYSSLSCLERLPLDELKIDQSFVFNLLEGIHSKAIIKTILGLANTMGLKVTAEGVENEQQFGFLKESGCHHFQGYYFGRPCSASDLKNF